jgi:hypothetical protein
LHLTFQSSIPRCCSSGRSPVQPIILLPFLQERKCQQDLFGASPAWAAVRLLFGSGVNVKELASVAEIACKLSGLGRPLRDVRRSFPGLIHWFDDHWAVVRPILSMIQLHDSDNRVINSRRELFDCYGV